MKARTATVLSIFLIGFAFAACDNQANDLPDEAANNTTGTTGKHTIEITGEVQHTSLEGGAWIIHGSDSTQYEPLNLADEYKEEGLKVRIMAERQPDKMSFLQIGPIIEIKSIEKR